MPRPTRLRLAVAPLGGRNVERFVGTVCFPLSQPGSSILVVLATRLPWFRNRVIGRSEIRSPDEPITRSPDIQLFHHLNKVWNFGNHAPDRLRVFALDHLVQPAKAQPLDHRFMFYRRTDLGADVL